MYQKELRIVKLKTVSNSKIGKIIKNDIKTEPAEDSTFVHLTQFGFDIELIKPTSIKKSNNPDALISGTIWEIKSPESSNPSTIKNRLRKASKQAKVLVVRVLGRGSMRKPVVAKRTPTDKASRVPVIVATTRKRKLFGENTGVGSGDGIFLLNLSIFLTKMGKCAIIERWE